jgi:hypothetical protein
MAPQFAQPQAVQVNSSSSQLLEKLQLPSSQVAEQEPALSAQVPNMFVVGACGYGPPEMMHCVAPLPSVVAEHGFPTQTPLMQLPMAHKVPVVPQSFPQLSVIGVPQATVEGLAH